MRINSAVNKLWKASRPKPWPLEKPTVIQFPVNDICNSRCQMCNIWQKKLDYQITPKELATALDNPLFSDVRSVGVNGGEPTLRKDLTDLVDVLYRELPSLKHISLITNAYQDQIVIKRISEVGQVVKQYGGNLDVMVSLDGVGEVHDRVRGKPNNFERAVRVIDYIQASNYVNTARLGCTVIRDNVYDLHNLLEFAIGKEIYIKYRIGIPHQRLYSQNVVTPFALTFEELYHFVVFLENLIVHYERSDGQILFYQSLIDQLIYGKPRAAGCDWQHRGVTLSARGELLYCAVKSKTLGSAVKQNPKELYFGNSDHLEDIVRNECDSCLHDYVGLPSRSALLRLYRRKMTEKLQLPPRFKKNPIASRARFLRQKRLFDSRLKSFSVNTAKLSDIAPALQMPSRTASNPNVLICGWYGTETLGDKAILGGVIKAIEANLDNATFHLASLETYVSEMTVRQMPELENCNVHTIPQALTLVNSMDLVVFGGGPLMAISDLAEVLAIFQRAAASGIPTLVAGCGIGPLNQSFHNEAIRNILSLSTRRVYRDQKSLQLAQSLGIDTTNDQVAEDPAFTWLNHTVNNLTDLQEESSSKSKLRLVLGLRDWPYFQYAPHMDLEEAQKLKDRFEEEVVSALELLLNQYPDLTIVPFPMCTNHIGGDDRWFYRRLFRENATVSAALDLTYLGREVDPSTAVKLFQTSSVALTMRYHSLIFALAAGTSAVSIDYTLGQGKVYSLADKYDVPQLRLDQLDRESIVEMLSETLANPLRKPLFEFSDLKFVKAISACISSS